MIKLFCDKHNIIKDLKSTLLSAEQYFELETAQRIYLVCKACFAEAAWKAQTAALKATNGL